MWKNKKNPKLISEDIIDINTNFVWWVHDFDLWGILTKSIWDLRAYINSDNPDPYNLHRAN